MKAILLPLMLGLAACVPVTASDVRYSPAGPPGVRGSPAIATVAVSDAREEKDPTYVGAIRSGIGSPLKTLTTPKPITEEVADAFGDALRQRNLLAPSAADGLSVRLTKFSANQLVRRDASVAFTLRLMDARGDQIYEDRVDVRKVNGSLLTFDSGAFASIGDLRAIMVQALTEAVDQAVDKPAFLAAVARR